MKSMGSYCKWRTSEFTKSCKYVLCKSSRRICRKLTGAVIGKKDVSSAGAKANGIRSVIGGEYAGGFFGLADVAAVAEVSGNGPTNTILNLINLGKIDVLDSFRTYVYDSK